MLGGSWQDIRKAGLRSPVSYFWLVLGTKPLEDPHPRPTSASQHSSDALVNFP